MSKFLEKVQHIFKNSKPSYLECVEMVRTDWRALQYVQEQTEEIKLIALSQNDEAFVYCRKTIK